MRMSILLLILAAAAVVGYFLLPDGRQAKIPTAATGEPMIEVVVPELTGNARLGEKIFEAKCAVCHGRNAAGQKGIAPPLVHQIYRPGHHADAAFLLAPRNGVRAHHWTFGNMPPVPGVTDGDLKMVVAYIRALQRANGIN